MAQTRLLSFLYSADVGTSSTPSLLSGELVVHAVQTHQSSPFTRSLFSNSSLQTFKIIIVVIQPWVGSLCRQLSLLYNVHVLSSGAHGTNMFSSQKQPFTLETGDWAGGNTTFPLFLFLDTYLTFPEFGLLRRCSPASPPWKVFACYKDPEVKYLPPILVALYKCFRHSNFEL